MDNTNGNKGSLALPGFNGEYFGSINLTWAPEKDNEK
jgi:hypothetical protein